MIEIMCLITLILSVIGIGVLVLLVIKDCLYGNKADIKGDNNTVEQENIEDMDLKWGKGD